LLKKEERILEDDELLYDALRVVVEIGHASASTSTEKTQAWLFKSRKDNRPAEDKGFIGGYDGSKPREVLVSKDELEDMLGGK